MKKYKLKLIHAADYREWKYTIFPTLGLPMLAAVTPGHYDIEIVDERAMKNNLDDKPDIVGISFECYRQYRAFELARHYRKKGVKVVFGGVHATAVGEELLKHCDTVVKGEAEELWPILLEDFEKGQLKKEYSQNTPVDLSKLPLPRMDLIDLNRYTFVYPVQAARGCPYGCRFCFAKVINPTYRTFPVEYVVEQAKRSPRKALFFMDDNFSGDRDNCIKVLKALTPLNKSIYFQANMHVGKDVELLKIMRAAGCKAIFAGMESINKESLNTVEKGFNKVRDYEECIRGFKKYGIEPKLGIIFGFDKDAGEIFDDTLDFLGRNNVLHVAPNLIIPYPGTEQYDMYDKQDRILTKDFRFYDGRNVLVKPLGMTTRGLISGYSYFMNKYYSLKFFLIRLRKNFFKPKSCIGPLFEFSHYHALKIKQKFTRKVYRF